MAIITELDEADIQDDEPVHIPAAYRDLQAMTCPRKLVQS
jgi:hypothetical protein